MRACVRACVHACMRACVRAIIRDHNGNKCLNFFVSSLYLMYFVFISYVYLYNVFTFYIT